MSANIAIDVYCGIILVALFPICVLIVLFYAEPGFPWHTYITLTIGYYAAFGIMLLVPIDIATVVVDRRSTNIAQDSTYDYDKETLTTIYNIFFTLVLIMGSAVLSFEEYYNTDGYFTIGGKLANSFKRMVIDTAVPVVVGLIILGILIGQHVVSSNADALKLAAVLVTNTMYELFLMFLLGYSLVEYPRQLWQVGDVRGYLVKTQMKAASEFKAISEHQLSVSLVCADVLKTKAALANYADPRLMEAMEILLSECPPEFRSDRLGKVATNKQGQITIDTLANLRLRLNVEKDLYKMSQEKVEGTKLLAYRLEDIVAAMDNPAATVIHWSLIDKDSTEWDYKWEITYKPILFKVAAVVCGVLSILSFLGVVCSMTGVSNNVSLYFLAVHADTSTVGGIAIFILLTFGYTVYIATWAIFQIRTGASSELVQGRTTPEALSFNVRMVARLAAPLAFFYLGWISENGIRTGDWTYNNAPPTNTTVTMTHIDPLTNVTSTYNTTVLVSDQIFMPSSFSNFYQLSSVNAVQEVFGTVFPIVLYVVMVLCALNVFNRLLVLCKLNAYQFGTEVVTEEQLREGKRQLQRHRKGSERKFRRGQLRNFIAGLGAGDAENGPGLCARLFGWSSGANAATDKQTLRLADERVAQIKEPAALTGQVDRKAAGFSLGVGSGWKEHYAEVRSPGYLHIYKDRRAAELTRGSGDPGYSSDPSVTIVDLRLVQSFNVPANDKGNVELDIALADDVVRLKFKNASDRETWKTRLAEWKDFIMDYGTLYPNGLPNGVNSVSDVESGSTSRTSYARANTNNNSNSHNARDSHTRNPIDLSQIDVDQDGANDGGLDEDNTGVRPFLSPYSSSNAAKSKSSFSSVFSFGHKKKTQELMAPAAMEPDTPAPLEGWLEKKGGGRLGGDNWQKRYVRVDEAKAQLCYWKSSDMQEKAQGAIDLKVVQEIAAYEKKGGADYSRFNVDAGDKVFKFRAPNEAEGQRWIEGLNAWRDHFLLNM